MRGLWQWVSMIVAGLLTGKRTVRAHIRACQNLVIEPVSAARSMTVACEDQGNEQTGATALFPSTANATEVRNRFALRFLVAHANFRND